MTLFSGPPPVEHARRATHASALVASHRLRKHLLLVCIIALSACSGPLTSEVLAPAQPHTSAATIETADADASAGNLKSQATTYEQQAAALLEQGAYPAAIASYDRVLALDPTNARAYHNRGRAYAASGNAEQALADYAQAISIAPTDTAIYRSRIELLQQRDDLRGLADDYAHLAALDMTNRASYLYARGGALQSLRDFDAARRAYDDALAANPDYADALYERALVAMAQSRSADAVRDLDRAAQLTPSQAKIYYARGLAYTATASYERARADFSQALTLKPGHAAALLGRAAAAYAAGDVSAAKADLAQLKQLDLEQSLQVSADRLRQQVEGQS